MFIVQESIHADHVSRHATREDATAAIDSLIRSGVAKPGELNIREVDADGTTVGVSSPSLSAAASAALMADVPLTPRELEVLRLLAEGRTYQETAERLFISVTALKVHVRQIRAKLEADARTRSVAQALDTLTD